MTEMDVGDASLDLLMERNEQYISRFKQNALMLVIKSADMQDKAKREKLLDCIQVFSNYFQKAVQLRSVLTDHPAYLRVAEQHLREEFGHHLDLARDRKYRPPVWDPVLEAASAWFAWKMMTLDNEERTLIIHLVMESSANVFFIEANKVMRAYGETDYFDIHAELDEGHEQMGEALLKNHASDKYKRLCVVQQQAWDMLNTVCERIAQLVTGK